METKLQNIETSLIRLM